ncbi:MAG: CBS domain-containing protein [bacterium]|nr:CBS domain-containing protein [bacterium]
MKGLKVKDVMTRGVITIPQDASVREAVEILADNDVSGLAVTSDEGELIGVLSETDMARVVSENMESEEDLGKIRVSEVMAAPAITVNREDDLREACRIMYRNNIHRLIVQQEVKRGEQTKYFPSGILSISDIVKVLAGRKLHG